jgi:hypothetical protein
MDSINLLLISGVAGIQVERGALDGWRHCHGKGVAELKVILWCFRRRQQPHGRAEALLLAWYGWQTGGPAGSASGAVAPGQRQAD